MIESTGEWSLLTLVVTDLGGLTNCSVPNEEFSEGRNHITPLAFKHDRSGRNVSLARYGDTAVALNIQRVDLVANMGL